MKLQARRAAVTKPGLALRPDARKVKAGETITVEAVLRGIKSVSLSIEPRGSFTLDRKTLARTGLVRLKARKHGKATLIAEGDGLRRLIHVACEGPILALGQLEYLPPR